MVRGLKFLNFVVHKFFKAACHSILIFWRHFTIASPICSSFRVTCITVIFWYFLQGGDILAIGSRDRHLNIVDLRKYDSDKPDSCKDMKIFADQKTHKVSA